MMLKCVLDGVLMLFKYIMFEHPMKQFFHLEL